MEECKETVLITGASSGIGEALARVFAEHGHDMILVARGVEKLGQLADELTGRHKVNVSVRPVDLSQTGGAESLAGALRLDGRQVDILVNSAGVLEHGAFIDISPQDHQRMVQLNVAGLTDILAHFVPDMVARRSGRIMNVSSFTAFQPVPSLATYAATKAYVLSLSEALAEELRSADVTVTALCPGFTATNMLAGAGTVGNQVPPLLVGGVEEVARYAFKACMKGKPIAVPGALNLTATLIAGITPKWVMRRLMGVLGRSTL